MPDSGGWKKCTGYMWLFLDTFTILYPGFNFEFCMNKGEEN